MKNIMLKNIMLSVAILFSALICTIGSAQTQGTIPAGAAIRVRTIDPINVSSARPGSRFRGTLADPVNSSDGAVLIPRGAPVQLSAVNVQRSGRVRGRDRISLKVDSITFNGRTYPVVTTISESSGGRQGSRTLRRTGVGAGGGAVIGGIAGGGKGAAVGSLVGGGGGTAVAAATGGKHLRIPPETLLSFQLQSPLSVR
jgi:hypothetical protein